jgi:hypothetical protein
VNVWMGCTGWTGSRRGYRRIWSVMHASGGSNRLWRRAGGRVRISRCFKAPPTGWLCGHGLRSGIQRTMPSTPGPRWTAG